MSFRRLVVTGQGLYYIATGAWPLISYSSFDCVTGPKVDDWLVRTVGGLAIAIGCGLLAGSRWREVSTETFVLASAAAMVFATVDIVYALGGRISKIYLADAVVELLMLPILVSGIFSSRRRSSNNGNRSVMLVVASMIVAHGIVLAEDASQCFEPGTCWLPLSDSTYSSGALDVPGWKPLHMQKARMEVDLKDCEYVYLSDFLRIVYKPEPNMVLAGCRGDFNGDSRDDYALLMQSTNGKVLPHVFIYEDGRFRSTALPCVCDHYEFDQNGTSPPGPCSLKRPANGIFKWESEFGPVTYSSIGDLLSVGWLTYAWADTGFVVVHSAD